MATMTEAYNAFKSTLKSDWDLGKTVFGTMRDTSKKLMNKEMGWNEALSQMKGIPDSLYTGMGGNWKAAARMGGWVAAGAAGTIAAADYANPWGVGWGD